MDRQLSPVTTPSENEKLLLLSGALILSAGITRFNKPKRVNAALPAGVKTVVLLSGRVQIRIGEGAEREICGPAVLVIRTINGAERDQVFAADVPVRYVIVQMNENLMGADMSAALDRSFTSRDISRDNGALLMSGPAGHALQALTSQIMNCPIRGAERELYLGGKALQLAALAISSCISQANSEEALQLSSKEIERIRQARELLIASMQKPPSLEGLAQQVGLNVRKLSDGFRRVYGSTVFGFLQEYRLEQAYKLISSGEMSVSEAAYHVGYGAAHFATIFRKRFGISPSSLR
ncbi:helix-turn-helix domain-containing protein [Tardiphaga sp. 1201_B9_N1_1]|uniref:helix-turn-helix domain-containing protein n=1 Tax=unclassified Tardiphaga TaxID=2631404 RepID=UPI003F22BD73